MSGGCSWLSLTVHGLACARAQAEVPADTSAQAESALAANVRVINHVDYELYDWATTSVDAENGGRPVFIAKYPHQYKPTTGGRYIYYRVSEQKWMFGGTTTEKHLADHTTESNDFSVHVRSRRYTQANCPMDVRDWEY